MVKKYIHIVPPEEEEKIVSFINTNSPASVFHSLRTFYLYSQTRRYETVYYIKYDEDKICGVMLVAIITSYYIGALGRRALIMQPPVIKHNDPEIFTEFWNAFKADYGKAVIFAEIRNIYPEYNLDTLLISNGFKAQKRINLIINFDSKDTFSQLSESKQRQVNKALEAGVSIEPFSNKDEVDTFYGILKNLYKRKIKKPLPNRSFFQAAYRFSRNDEDIHMVAVKYQRMVIGGMLLAGIKGQTIYEWYIGGLHDEYKHLYPSVMATWGGIQKALELNATCFDFMGGGVPDKPYGVRDFKARFGSKEVYNYRWRWTHYPKILRLISKFISILKF